MCFPLPAVATFQFQPITILIQTPLPQSLSLSRSLYPFHPPPHVLPTSPLSGQYGALSIDVVEYILHN